MRYLIILSIVLFSCGTHKIAKTPSYNTTTEQVFIEDQTKGLPGKCYSQTKKGEEFRWTEVICDNYITNELIAQIQKDLRRLGFEIEEEEFSTSTFGSTTRFSIVDFQKQNDMNYGGIDWATVNRLNQAKN